MGLLKIGFTLILVSVAAHSSLASSEVLTWEHCVDLTSKTNAELQSARSTLESNQYLIKSSRSGFLPQLTAVLSYTQANSISSSSASTFLVSANPGGTYSATLSGTQNLFNGMQDLAKVRQAEANALAARYALDIARAKISYDLKYAFQALLYAKEYQKLTQEIIRRREDNLRLVELRFQSGGENKGSVLLSRANLNQARYDDLQAQNAERVSHALLAKALGIDDPLSFEITGEIPIDDSGTRPVDFRPLAMRAPAYAQSAAQEASAAENIVLARAGFLPTLNLTGSVGSQGADFFPSARNIWSVGANLTLPFYNGGRDFYSTRSATSLWQAADQARASVSRNVLSELERTYAAYIEAILKLKVDTSFREAATVRSEIARKRYNTGLMTFEDWDVIESDLITRQKSYLQSRRDRVIAEAAWEQTQGKGVIP